MSSANTSFATAVHNLLPGPGNCFAPGQDVAGYKTHESSTSDGLGHTFLEEEAPEVGPMWTLSLCKAQQDYGEGGLQAALRSEHQGQAGAPVDCVAILGGKDHCSVTGSQ